MQLHRFSTGQVVRLMARDGDAPDKVAKYKVTRLLPSDGVGFRYCLEHEELLFSRLAWERDLIGVISPGWRIETPSNSP
jgi:hypothetical protein